MHAEKREKRRNPRRHATLMRLLGYCLGVLVMLALAITNILLPFRGLIPATQVKARAEGELAVHVLSVGQADCSIVEFPDGELLVIDGGDGSWAASNAIVAYLKGLRVESSPRVNYLLTHADGDHIGGLSEVVSLFGGETLYTPYTEGETEGYSELLRTATSAGVFTERLTRYGVLAHSSGAYVSCLSPLMGEEGEGNALSTVLYLRYGEISMLFCGDISAAREERLLEEYATDETIFDTGEYPVRLDGVNVVKAAHHGSKWSSSQEWLNLLGAEQAIFSCGAGNYYDHPSSEAMAAFKTANAECKLYRTDELGAIVVRMQKNTYAVEYGE